MIAQYIKFFLKNLYLIFYKQQKSSIILNYHRIGIIDPKNPFHRLHTVSFNIFKLQIKICSMIGKIISLEDLKNSNLKSQINFSITFDDVPYSSLIALNWLNDKNIPFAICPCHQITNEGIGWRDKVYFIEKYIKKRNIINQINKAYREVNYDVNDSFYNLSKSSKFEQMKMIRDVVSPLFKEISTKVNQFATEKNYFDANDLMLLKQSFKNMEIVNHSSSHTNLTHLNNSQLEIDMGKCDKFLEQELHHYPKYFAVPFGQFDSSLSVGLCEIARKNNKEAIFWVANHINLDFGKKPNKIKQFCRFHTSTSVLGFCKQIFASFCRPSFTDQITKKFSIEAKEHLIVSNPSIEKILAFEDISRPTKDYSGSISHLKNFYLDNPFLGDSKHTIAEIQNERIMSIGQNLIMPFSGLGDKNLVNFFGNWRSISGSSKIGAAVILRNAMKEAKLLVSYKPSKHIEPTFIKMGWKPIFLNTFKCNLKKITSSEISLNFSVMHKLDKSYEINSFKSNAENTVQIELSRDLINWRVKKYKLAKPIYFIWNQSESEQAFVIAQYSNKEILLLDQRFSSVNSLLKISEQIITWCKDNNLSRLIAETSCLKTKSIFTKCLPKAEIKNSICYINLRKKDQDLYNKDFIFTPISSDVFLRP